MKKKHKLFNHDNKSFYSMLLFSFLTILVTSMLLLSTLLISIFFKSISSSTKNYNEQLLTQTNYTINQLDESIERLKLYLQSNKSVSSYLSMEHADSTTPVLASHEILNQLLVLPYIDSIYLYNANLDLFYSSKTGFQTSLETCEEKGISSNLENPDFVDSYNGSPIPYRKSEETKNIEIFSYYILSPADASDTPNAIIINLNTSMLTNSISSMKDFSAETESNFFLLDKNNTYLTSVLHSKIEKAPDFVASFLEQANATKNYDSSYIKIKGTTYFQIHTDKNCYGWHLFNLIPVSTLFHNVVINILLSLLIIIVIFILTWGLCRYFAKQLNAPLEVLTRHLNAPSSNAGLPKKLSFKPNEFQLIMSTVTSLKDNNEQLRSVQQKTKYSVTQSCLNELITNHYIDSPTVMEQKIRYLHLDYLNSEKLCMAVFKIDQYHNFIDQHDSDELWTLRFATVNIIEELASSNYTCNGFSRDNDKFVLILSCSAETDLVAFEDHFVLLLQSIQKKIEEYLHFTVSTTYSNVFQGIQMLPVVYRQMEDSLLLKIRLGNSAIIEPHLIDEVQTEPFQLSHKTTKQLIDSLSCGELTSAVSAYEDAIHNLFYCDYAEIHSTLLHLIHSIYEQLTEKYPMLKDTFVKAMKVFMSELSYAEISDDILSLSRTYFETICTAVQKAKEEPKQQNSVVMAKRIVDIIQTNYSDSSLCLATIADKVGLSSNYTGQIFKQYTQKSLSQYLLEIRMEKIAEYLQTTSLPLNKILELVGLEKNNYFYTRFKNYFGMSLNEYRAKFQSDIKEDDNV